VERLGETRVGLGSDFDGATMPLAIGDAAGLPRLYDALRAHGWDDDLLARVSHRNWIALLRRVQEA
jgi:membrane dipeptidase